MPFSVALCLSSVKRVTLWMFKGEWRNDNYRKTNDGDTSSYQSSLPSFSFFTPCLFFLLSFLNSLILSIKLSFTFTQLSLTSLYLFFYIPSLTYLSPQVLSSLAISPSLPFLFTSPCSPHPPTFFPSSPSTQTTRRA